MGHDVVVEECSCRVAIFLAEIRADQQRARLVDRMIVADGSFDLGIALAKRPTRLVAESRRSRASLRSSSATVASSRAMTRDAIRRAREWSMSRTGDLGADHDPPGIEAQHDSQAFEEFNITESAAP